MNIFLAGASGALGKRLVPHLVAAGHYVVASTRTPAKVAALRQMGAEAIVLDALDQQAVMKAVETARPEVVVHQMTALAGVHNLHNFDKKFRLTNRLRSEGTTLLIAAARAAGARRFVAQSYAGWPTGPAGSLTTEADAFDPDPPRTMRQSLRAIEQLEASVTRAAGISGIVLRYGSFYGPGTSLDTNGSMTEQVRRRKFPILGSGAGVWSFIHIDDAATATQIAIEGAPAGIYNIVDDDPAPVSVWLPDLARVLGAKPPLHLPVWLGRILAGEAVVSLMTKVRGSSNAKAKRVLPWQPNHSSWREGFCTGLSGC